VLGSLAPSGIPLTPRREETLRVLRRLAAGRGAVHYSEVGAAMGVSAWTAYALLRELERVGLAGRSYEAAGPDRIGGRPRILFMPRASDAPAELVDRLRRAVERFAAIGDQAAAARAYLAERPPGSDGDVAVDLGFWLARLAGGGRGAVEAVRSVLESGAVPAAKIQTVAAMGLGNELGQLDASRLASRVTAAVTGLSSRLEDAQRSSDAALAALVDAARRVLEGRRAASTVKRALAR
jgi:hypothetical protein